MLDKITGGGNKNVHFSPPLSLQSSVVGGWADVINADALCLACCIIRNGICM